MPRYKQQGGHGLDDTDAPWIVVCHDEQEADRLLAAEARCILLQDLLREANMYIPRGTPFAIQVGDALTRR